MANIGLGSQITTRSSSGGGGSSNSTLAVNQTAHGFSVGNAIYYTGTAWAKAQSNNAATLGVGIVTIVTDANNFTVMFEGFTSLLSGLTAGNYYFVSDSTPGVLTATEPTSPTSYSNPLYFAITATTGVVLPFRPSAIVGTANGGTSAYVINGSGLGTLEFTNNNASLAGWTTQAGTPSVDTGFDPGGGYKIKNGDAISINTGISTFAGTAIDFDFLWYSPTGALFDFIFGANATGAGPIMRFDGRFNTSNGCTSGNMATWTTFSGVAGTTTQVSLDATTDTFKWQHITLFVNNAGTAFDWYLNGVKQGAGLIFAALNGAYLGIYGDAGSSGAIVKNITVTVHS